MGASTTPLAALEVAIARAGASLAGLEDVGVHAEAHRAARIAPVRSRTREDRVQALRFGLHLHLGGSRHHEDAKTVMDAPTLEHRRGRAKVLDPAVGARAD